MGLMEAIEVTVHWDSGGQVSPLEFTWKGRAYRVESTGRRWQDEAGLHILTMVPGGQVYELVFDQASLKWYLMRRFGPPAVV